MNAHLIVDRIVLAYIGRRLASFRVRGDFADRFADRLIEILGREIERRKRLMDGWDAAAERARRFKGFEVLRPPKTGAM